MSSLKDKTSIVKNARKSIPSYIALFMGKTPVTTRECKVLKTKGKEKPNYSTNYYKRKSREVNLFGKRSLSPKG